MIEIIIILLILFFALVYYHEKEVSNGREGLPALQPIIDELKAQAVRFKAYLDDQTRIAEETERQQLGISPKGATDAESPPCHAQQRQPVSKGPSPPWTSRLATAPPQPLQQIPAKTTSAEQSDESENEQNDEDEPDLKAAEFVAILGLPNATPPIPENGNSPFSKDTVAATAFSEPKAEQPNTALPPYPQPPAFSPQSDEDFNASKAPHQTSTLVPGKSIAPSGPPFPPQSDEFVKPPMTPDFMIESDKIPKDLPEVSAVPNQLQAASLPSFSPTRTLDPVAVPTAVDADATVVGIISPPPPPPPSPLPPPLETNSITTFGDKPVENSLATKEVDFKSTATPKMLTNNAELPTLQSKDLTVQDEDSVKRKRKSKRGSKRGKSSKRSKKSSKRESKKSEKGSKRKKKRDSKRGNKRGSKRGSKRGRTKGEEESGSNQNQKPAEIDNSKNCDSIDSEKQKSKRRISKKGSSRGSRISGSNATKQSQGEEKQGSKLEDVRISEAGRIAPPNEEATDMSSDGSKRNSSKRGSKRGKSKRKSDSKRRSKKGSRRKSQKAEKTVANNLMVISQKAIKIDQLKNVSLHTKGIDNEPKSGRDKRENGNGSSSTKMPEGQPGIPFQKHDVIVEASKPETGTGSQTKAESVMGENRSKLEGKNENTTPNRVPMENDKKVGVSNAPIEKFLNGEQLKVKDAPENEKKSRRGSKRRSSKKDSERRSRKSLSKKRTSEADKPKSEGSRRRSSEKGSKRGKSRRRSGSKKISSKRSHPSGKQTDDGIAKNASSKSRNSKQSGNSEVQQISGTPNKEHKDSINKLSNSKSGRKPNSKRGSKRGSRRASKRSSKHEKTDSKRDSKQDSKQNSKRGSKRSSKRGSKRSSKRSSKQGSKRENSKVKLAAQQTSTEPIRGEMGPGSSNKSEPDKLGNSDKGSSRNKSKRNSKRRTSSKRGSSSAKNISNDANKGDIDNNKSRKSKSGRSSRKVKSKRSSKKEKVK